MKGLNSVRETTMTERPPWKTESKKYVSVKNSLRLFTAAGPFYRKYLWACVEDIDSSAVFY